MVLREWFTSRHYLQLRQVIRIRLLEGSTCLNGNENQDVHIVPPRDRRFKRTHEQNGQSNATVSCGMQSVRLGEGPASGAFQYYEYG